MQREDAASHSGGEHWFMQHTRGCGGVCCHVTAPVQRVPRQWRVPTNTRVKSRVQLELVGGGGGGDGGAQGPRKVWTHCETNADRGGEGPRDELALVVLDQQRGLAHAAVSHQDGLQEEDTHINTHTQTHWGITLTLRLPHCPRPLQPAAGTSCRLPCSFICCPPPTPPLPSVMRRDGWRSAAPLHQRRLLTCQRRAIVPSAARQRWDKPRGPTSRSEAKRGLAALLTNGKVMSSWRPRSPSHQVSFISDGLRE